MGQQLCSISNQLSTLGNIYLQPQNRSLVDTSRIIPRHMFSFFGSAKYIFDIFKYNGWILELLFRR